jgi:hypothetical protein
MILLTGRAETGDEIHRGQISIPVTQIGVLNILERHIVSCGTSGRQTMYTHPSPDCGNPSRQMGDRTGRWGHSRIPINTSAESFSVPFNSQGDGNPMSQTAKYGISEFPVCNGAHPGSSDPRENSIFDEPECELKPLR